jgi:hypothetical protein
MAKKTSKTAPAGEALCLLHDTDKLKAELFREGEGFRVHLSGSGRGKDKNFNSLPSLLSGLQAIFLEIRMSGRGLSGLAALARAQDDARQDVLGASRKIHSAMGSV